MQAGGIEGHEADGENRRQRAGREGGLYLGAGLRTQDFAGGEKRCQLGGNLRAGDTGLGAAPYV